MFPLGNLTKDIVKKIAKSIGLEKIANKKESMGICFVGKRKNGFQDFLKEYTETKNGPIINIETYKTIGEHNGQQFWTLGQGIKMGGMKERGYVCEKDVGSNTLYVAFGESHPALFSEHFHTETPYWIDHVPDELSDRSKDQVNHCVKVELCSPIFQFFIMIQGVTKMAFFIPKIDHFFCSF